MITNETNRFDSSKGRGDFKTAIGVGRVIQGRQKARHGFRKVLIHYASRLGHRRSSDVSRRESYFDHSWVSRCTWARSETKADRPNRNMAYGDKYVHFRAESCCFRQLSSNLHTGESVLGT